MQGIGFLPISDMPIFFNSFWPIPIAVYFILLFSFHFSCKHVWAELVWRKTILSPSLEKHGVDPERST